MGKKKKKLCYSVVMLLLGEVAVQVMRCSQWVARRCEEARYARKCPARTQYRSVRLREFRLHVYGPKS